MSIFGKKKPAPKPKVSRTIDRKLCGQMVFDKHGNGKRCGKKKGHWGDC